MLQRTLPLSSTRDIKACAKSRLVRQPAAVDENAPLPKDWSGPGVLHAGGDQREIAMELLSFCVITTLQSMTWTWRMQVVIRGGFHYFLMSALSLRVKIAWCHSHSCYSCL
jgi:hypothetical protein